MSIEKRHCRKCRTKKTLDKYSPAPSGALFKTCDRCRGAEKRRVVCQSCKKEKGYRMFYVGQEICKRCSDNRASVNGRLVSIKPSERCVICGFRREKMSFTCRREKCRTALFIIHAFVTMPPPEQSNELT